MIVLTTSFTIFLFVFVVLVFYIFLHHRRFYSIFDHLINSRLDDTKGLGNFVILHICMFMQSANFVSEVFTSRTRGGVIVGLVLQQLIVQ